MIDELLKQEKKYGYNFEGERVITLPYADDFTLLTSNLRSHQRIINEIDKKITSMGMRLKPSKCRSVSWSSGSPKDIPFNIKGQKLPSIKEEEQKFLGKLLFFERKSTQTTIHLKEELKIKLDFIDVKTLQVFQITLLAYELSI